MEIKGVGPHLNFPEEEGRGAMPKDDDTNSSPRSAYPRAGPTMRNPLPARRSNRIADSPRTGRRDSDFLYGDEGEY